jgi:hypothetical protein
MLKGTMNEDSKKYHYVSVLYKQPKGVLEDCGSPNRLNIGESLVYTDDRIKLFQHKNTHAFLRDAPTMIYDAPKSTM